MKRAISRLFLPALVLVLILAASSAEAMPLSEKASVNTSMPYFLVVDLTNQYVTALKTSGDQTEAVRYMICSTGRVSGTTPVGLFSIRSDDVSAWVAFESCYVRYGKKLSIPNRNIWFHSILYSSRSVSSLSRDSFNRLGSPASHGCIRLTPVDAQWISYNCKKGTSVRILRGEKNGETRTKAAELKNALKAGPGSVEPNLKPTPRPDLSVLAGSTGSLVKSLNSRLRSLGFYPGAITSSFTAETEAAVKAYQSKAGLDVTGVANDALQRMIATYDSVTGHLVTLKYGDNYVVVKELQSRLKALGYLKASYKLNTVYDKSTRSAVTAFQMLAGKAVDGVASPEVQDLLFGGAAPTPTPTPAPVYAITKRLMSLYKSKSTRSTRVAVVPSNRQVIVVVASDGTWTKAKYGSRTGYAQSKYLTAFPAPTPTPDPTPEP
jgi:peptidoglycan hydrolase-like protein with peptidoglycan-binding domain